MGLSEQGDSPRAVSNGDIRDAVLSRFYDRRHLFPRRKPEEQPWASISREMSDDSTPSEAAAKYLDGVKPWDLRADLDDETDERGAKGPREMGALAEAVTYFLLSGLQHTSQVGGPIGPVRGVSRQPEMTGPTTSKTTRPRTDFRVDGDMSYAVEVKSKVKPRQNWLQTIQDKYTGLTSFSDGTEAQRVLALFADDRDADIDMGPDWDVLRPAELHETYRAVWSELADNGFSSGNGPVPVGNPSDLPRLVERLCRPAQSIYTPSHALLREWGTEMHRRKAETLNGMAGYHGVFGEVLESSKEHYNARELGISSPDIARVDRSALRYMSTSRRRSPILRQIRGSAVPSRHMLGSGGPQPQGSPWTST